MINLEYCECGCHGFNFRAGSIFYWVFMELPSEKTSIHTYHRSYDAPIFTGTMSQVKKKLVELAEYELTTAITKNKAALKDLKTSKGKK